MSRLLNLLKKKGYTLAIVSNKIDGAVKALQEKYFPQADLALGERAEIPRKPAPDAIFFAIQCLGAKKEDCVYVGDSEVDVLTAKNAGIPSILVTWGFRDREELQKAGATHFANSCEELSLMVERLLS